MSDTVAPEAAFIDYYLRKWIPGRRGFWLGRCEIITTSRGGPVVRVQVTESVEGLRRFQEHRRRRKEMHNVSFDDDEDEELKSH